MRRILGTCAFLIVLAVVLSFSAAKSRRDVDARYDLDDGVLRTVVLGDSVAHGAGDETGLGLAGWLDLELRGRTASAIDSLNLALDGARTSNLASRLRESGIREAIARADLVVISIGGNDRAVRDGGASHRGAHRRGARTRRAPQPHRSLPSRLARYSAIARRIADTL